MTTQHTPAVAFATFKRTPCPALDIDAILYKGEPLPNRQLIEHRLVWNLLRFLAANDWIVCRLYDGEENHNFKGNIDERIKAAMEMVFNLDECTMLFQLEGSKKTHTVTIILGNDGWDAIADHTYSANDSDNFQAVMEDFDCESFINAVAEDFVQAGAEPDNAAFIERLVLEARKYGWSGDYSEVSKFVREVAGDFGITVTTEELEPLPPTD